MRTEWAVMALLLVSGVAESLPVVPLEFSWRRMLRGLSLLLLGLLLLRL